MSQKEREAVTVQLLHTALEDIFYSVPEMPNARLEPLLEPYTDAFDLTMMLVADQLILPPKMVETQRTYVSSEGLGAPISKERQTVAVLRSTQYLIGLAFEDCYNAFVDNVAALVENSLKTAKHPYNRYATVKLEPHVTHRGQIQQLELQIGEDIRFIHYRQCFPNKRYRPNGVDRSHRLDRLPEDSE
ncbi:hypothetical protein pEaSNUABM29_00150 [Erwinia phage pEa_SNUABM_29]|nr:hypothetical protein pEaSNUABM29_00150 [Erwinia phage pEa_SNUABM_29]